MTDHIDGTLAGAAGRKLYWQAWIGAGPVRGVVSLVHGAHEHSGRYDWVAEQLCAAGYPVYAIDHTGHGKSEGVRGRVDRFDDLVDGVDALISLASGRHPNVPRFVLAHSLGSLITLKYVEGAVTPSIRVLAGTQACAGSPRPSLRSRVVCVAAPKRS